MVPDLKALAGAAQCIASASACEMIYKIIPLIQSND